VALGLGVGIVASMAVRQNGHEGLKVIDASHLFAQNVTRLAVRRGAYLRQYTLDLIQQLSPELTREDIDLALRNGG
ncbi:MAG TPA: transcriptional regulator, partial [Oxalicibacterium sp.]|nr:transcriptional regulator [Oxalicibacterium sp.]